MAGFAELLSLWQSRADRRDLHAGERRLVVLLDAANEAGNVPKLLKELSARAKAALVTEATNRTAEATRPTIAAVKEGNEKVEMLEIVFLTYYSIELVHILMGLLAAGAEKA